MKHSITLFVTQKCNLRCPYCFVDKESEELQIWEIDKLFVTNRSHINHVTLTGGEPMMRHDIGLVIGVLKFLRIPFTLCTNGYKWENLVEYLQRISTTEYAIQVSIDGNPDTHDRLRGTGSYERAHSLLQHIGKSSIPSNIVITVSNTNIGSVKDVLDLSLRVKVPCSINFVRGKPPDINPGQMSDVINAWVRYAKLFGFSRQAIMMHAQRMKIVRDYLHHRKTWPFPCIANGQLTTLWANGDIGPCEKLPPIGNIRRWNYNLKPAWREMQVNRDGCYCDFDCEILHSMKSVRGFWSLIR